MARLYLIAALLAPLLQISFAVHAWRTGKERFWLWIILMFPYLGSVVYFISEVLPKLRRTGELLLWLESIPWFRTRELHRLEDQLEDAPTIDNRLNLATACVRQGKLERAIELYHLCLKGPHQNDPHILRSLADALTKHEDWKALLDAAIKLRSLLPEREINDAIRWEAIALDGLERTDEAEERYLHLIDFWPGEEIRCRLATMLARQKRYAEARKHFEVIQRHLRRGTRFFRRQNKTWAKSTSAWLKYLDQQSSAAA